MSTKARFATLRKPVKGKFSRWKKGEVVRAWQWHYGIYTIEKAKHIPAGTLKDGLPLLNFLIGVPRSLLKFHKPV